MGGMPTVALAADDISHAMAARLTMALLGHILYMKGQVPFPIPSIARMAEYESDEPSVRPRTALRAAKKRAEFLQSYDDLTSHLQTTFVAVSTALAFNETRYPLLSPSDSSSTRPLAKVYVLLMLGPSAASAKMRTLLELNGLRTERFGEQEFMRRQEIVLATSGSDDDTGSDSGGEDGITLSYAAETDARCISTTSSSSSHPPRTPSPAFAFTSPRTRSLSHSSASSSHSSRAEYPPPSPSIDSSLSETADSEDSQLDDTVNTNVPALPQRAEEAALRAGEQLLSRTLVTAGEGLGFGDEISPTQAHILIRAPRRLSHPTWVPRESLRDSLDRHVQRFLDTESHQIRTRGKPAFGAGAQTIGVRVTCRGLETLPDDTIEGPTRNIPESDEESGDQNENEGDELIWWSWDGKLVGFAD